MRGKSIECNGQREVVSHVFADKFFLAVHLEGLDDDVVLILQPGFMLLVVEECAALLSQEIAYGVEVLLIRQTHGVFPSEDSLCVRMSPDVGMYNLLPHRG